VDVLPHRPVAPRAGVVGSDRRLVGPPAATRRSERSFFSSSVEELTRDMPRGIASRKHAHTMTRDGRVDAGE
jgi:hypothetical protein